MIQVVGKEGLFKYTEGIFYQYQMSIIFFGYSSEKSISHVKKFALTTRKPNFPKYAQSNGKTGVKLHRENRNDRFVIKIIAFSYIKFQKFVKLL